MTARASMERSSPALPAGTRGAGVPLLAIVGGIDESSAGAYDLGVTAMFSINREAKSFAESAPQSAENYRRTLADICRLLRAMT